MNENVYIQGQSLERGLDVIMPPSPTCKYKQPRGDKLLTFVHLEDVVCLAD